MSCAKAGMQKVQGQVKVQLRQRAPSGHGLWGPAPTPNARGRAPRSVTQAGYKFGDLSKRLAQEAKAKLEQVGQSITGDEGYRLGDFSRALLGQLQQVDLQRLSRDALDKVMSYQFGDITKSALQTEWGHKLLDAATMAGQRISGNPDYQVGDLTREVASKLAGAKDRAQRLLALPDEVELLKAIVVEQNILIQRLTDEPGSMERTEALLMLKGSAEDLKPVVLDNQEVIDIILSSQDNE